MPEAGAVLLGLGLGVGMAFLLEYLDNTLPAEDVADLERMCLEPGNEADMHLAEVASCHHVLTMVLGEPAEISLGATQTRHADPSAGGGVDRRAQPAGT